MKTVILFAGVFLLLSGTSIYGQDAQPSPPPSDKSVSREEYEKLKSELDELKVQMAELVKNKSAPTPAAPAEGPSGDSKSVAADGKEIAQSDEIAELRDQLAKVKDSAESIRPGTTNFLLTGYAFAGFESRKGEPSTFTAGLSPIFLWQLNDKLFFEGELELGQVDSETEVNLEYAHLTYLLNDYISLGAGKFLTPFGQFPDRLHAAWINKLPDFPLAFNEDEGLIAFSQLGAEARGAIPIGPTKLTYAVYVSNGPRLITDSQDGIGALEFDNFTDIDHNKAVGGRVALLPLPGLEAGYSVQYAQVNAPDTSANHANVLWQGLDASYVHDFDWLKGGVDVRGEWVWSRVSNLTYDPTGELGFGPLTYDNRRNGGYAQITYRPYKIKQPIIQKLELVGRYDTINQPNDVPGTFDERRWSFGLNYWLGQSTVLKAAYEFGHRRSTENGGEDVDAFLLQAAMGF